MIWRGAVPTPKQLSQRICLHKRQASIGGIYKMLKKLQITRRSFSTAITFWAPSSSSARSGHLARGQSLSPYWQKGVAERAIFEVRFKSNRKFCPSDLRAFKSAAATRSRKAGRFITACWMWRVLLSVSIGVKSHLKLPFDCRYQAVRARIQIASTVKSCAMIG